MSKITTIIAAAALMAVPGSLIAGGYGSSGVKDDRVGRYASADDEVYCGRLDRNIPASLAAQMDCGGFARPKVANNRITNFFGILRRVPNRVIVTDDDNPVEPKRVSSPKSEPNEEPKSEPKSEPKGEPKSEPKGEPKSEPKSEPKEEPKSEPKGEPKSEPKEEPKSEPKGEPKSEPKSEPKGEPKSEPKSKNEKSNEVSETR